MRVWVPCDSVSWFLGHGMRPHIRRERDRIPPGALVLRHIQASVPSDSLCSRGAEWDPRVEAPDETALLSKPRRQPTVLPSPVEPLVSDPATCVKISITMDTQKTSDDSRAMVMVHRKTTILRRLLTESTDAFLYNEHGVVLFHGKCHTVVLPSFLPLPAFMTQTVPIVFLSRVTCCFLGFRATRCHSFPPAGLSV